MSVYDSNASAFAPFVAPTNSLAMSALRVYGCGAVKHAQATRTKAKWNRLQMAGLSADRAPAESAA
jgi:hypothetical protein